MRMLVAAIFLNAFLSGQTMAAGPTWPITDMPRFWVLGEGNAHYSLDASYFYSKENYDAQGVVSQPANMENARFGNARFHGAFGFTPRISVFAQADARGLFVSNTEGSNVSDDENYGFGDAWIGMRWLAYQSRPSDRIYPTEWSPKSFHLIFEASWLFPLYDKAPGGKPPLGDQSNDFSLLGRLAWYANEWLALSSGAGYIHRTAGYSAALPWNIRADFAFLRNQKFRFWLDFQAQEALSKSGDMVNPGQPDPIPGGSLVFKSDSPTLRWATIGAGYLLSKEWELAGAGLFTASGVNAGKGFGGALGLSWRPYQVPELAYTDYREREAARIAREPREYRRREVVRYGFKATILKVSHLGNFFKIGYGSQDGVKAGDTFQVFKPDDFSGQARRPLAFATVEAVRTKDSFLRVVQKYDLSTRIDPGYEAQRVILSE